MQTQSARRAVSLAIGAMASLACVAGASAHGVPPELKKLATCMVETLQSVPGVDRPEMGVTDTPDWAYPYVQYRYTDKTDGQRTIRFVASRTPVPGGYRYSFQVELPGMVAAGKAAPDDWGTGEVTRLWKARCGTDVDVLFG
jgi:hypothetical protein